jgi:hypothetical protein
MMTTLTLYVEPSFVLCFHLLPLASEYQFAVLRDQTRGQQREKCKS